MADNNQNGCLTVGEGVKLVGNFVVPDIASISGTIEGEITAREILVGSTGIIKGKVTAEVVDVRGEIHDNLTANKSLFIRSTGKVIGTVQYAEIEIEKGGDLQGNLLKSANGHSAS
jgi:cytoskeletal protein CcmA (bactofilin family)